MVLASVFLMISVKDSLIPTFHTALLISSSASRNSPSFNVSPQSSSNWKEPTPELVEGPAYPVRFCSRDKYPAPLIWRSRDLEDNVFCLLPRTFVTSQVSADILLNLPMCLQTPPSSLSTRVITMGSSFTHVIGSQKKLIQYSLRTPLP